MNKSIRDAAVTGAPATLVLSALMSIGVSAEMAALLSVVASALASAIYRAVRQRWPWLLAMDAPSGAK